MDDYAGIAKALEDNFFYGNHTYVGSSNYRGFWVHVNDKENTSTAMLKSELRKKKGDDILYMHLVTTSKNRKRLKLPVTATHVQILAMELAELNPFYEKAKNTISETIKKLVATYVGQTCYIEALDNMMKVTVNGYCA